MNKKQVHFVGLFFMLHEEFAILHHLFLFLDE